MALNWRERINGKAKKDPKSVVFFKEDKIETTQKDKSMFFIYIYVHV